MATAGYDDGATFDRDRSLLTNHLLPRFGSLPVAGIKTADVREWVVALPLAPATVALCYQLLGRMLRQAEEDRLIVRSPVTNIKLPRNRRNKQAERWLRRDELLRLAETIEPRFRCVILTMGYMGLRFGEVAGLTLERVDLLHGTLEVANSLQERAGTLRLKEPKTAESRRKLPLPAFMADELRVHIGAHPSPAYALDCEEGTGTRRFLFTGRDGAPLRKTWARRHFKPAAERAGLSPPPLRPHHLRHTAVSLLISQGAREKDVQEWCGHSSYQVTMNTYVHLFPERQGQLAELIDRLHRPPARAPKVATIGGAKEATGSD